MSLETSIRECGASLSSSRVTDRKKNGEMMKNYLSGNAAPALLTENTLQNKGYTWTSLFDDINDLVLKETEKYESSKTFETVSGPLCASLLGLCVSGSIKGQAYVQCVRVIDQCLLILRDKRLRKAIGDAYLNILYKYVLTCDHYVINITPVAWEELLDVCVEICGTKFSKLDDFAKLRLLLLIMRNARNCCQFVIPLRDCLSKVKQKFLSLTCDRKVQEVVIDINIVLLETLSAECRATMCEYTENLLPSFLKFYDQNIDQKKKSSLFKLLNLIVKLHHPLGKTQQENGSLASNWEVWNKQLNSTLELVCLEVAFIQKQRKSQENLLKLSSDFYELTASIYYQIFHLATTDNVEVEASSSKRVRLSYSRSKSFRDIVDEMSQNHTPWLKIIHMFVKFYGHTLHVSDLVPLLSVVDGLISNSSNKDWNSLGEIVCLTVKHYKTKSSGDKAYVMDNEEIKAINGVLRALWNSCVRSSTSLTPSHIAIHSMMQILLCLNNINYQHAMPLIKLYFEKAMPVTESSLMTLNIVFRKYFNKFNKNEDRSKCFCWLTSGQIITSAVCHVKELLLRLLATENVIADSSGIGNNDTDLHDILFHYHDNAILFSSFEMDLQIPNCKNKDINENYELSMEMLNTISAYLLQKLSVLTIVNKEDNIIDIVNFSHVFLVYHDILLKYKFIEREKIENESLFKKFRCVLQNMYKEATDFLNSIADIRQHIQLLQALKVILMEDYDTLLNAEVRRVPPDFFKCLNVIVNKKISADDGEVYQDDDTPMDPQALRHVCICVLAAYCRKKAGGRNEILEFILDPKIYNFATSWDVSCALECIDILDGPCVESQPLELTFALMQGMCKVLFKNSQATFRLLKAFLRMFDKIRNLENGKENCYIMIRGYLQRCEKKNYPPEVAALIYESAIRMCSSNLKYHEDVDDMFVNAVKRKVKGEIHSLRVYCCYLLKPLLAHLSDRDIDEYLTSLIDLFVFNVSEMKDTILKDETENRTATVLHSVFALVEVKNSLLHGVLSELLQMQKEKSLNKSLVKKVLNKMTTLVADKSVENYCNDNVLFILNTWYSKGYIIDNMPFYLFGLNGMSGFIEKHFKWAIPADILWRTRGSLKDSTVLKYVLSNSDRSAEDIIEICICNIIALCIPYVVIEKYKLGYSAPGKHEWSQFAIKLFESTRDLLGADKWSTLFVENISELVVLVTMNLCDYESSKQQYRVNLPKQNKSYQYPKIVLDAILKHMGELIEEDILNYLCENQALTIFKALFQLWDNVNQEKVFEYKVLHLNSFVTFLLSIPLSHASDSFVCNFACSSLGYAIRESTRNEDIRVLTISLKNILDKIIPQKASAVRKPVSQILTILMVKKDEGFEVECAELLDYLVCDMKDFLKESEDVIDFVSSLSQRTSGNLNCATKSEFLYKLKNYKNNLTCLSHETLINMRDFLKTNKNFTIKLCEELNPKGFSDDCGTSLLHEVIHSLTNILKSATDDKTLIEACNCLAEIGNYDLKTLVTVPPANTTRVTNIEPKQYFAIVTMTSLADILFDKSPLVTNAISKALKRLLQYREGEIALDLDEENKKLLVPLASSSCDIYAEFKIIDGRFKALCAKGFWNPRPNEIHTEWLMRVTCAILEVLASPANYLSSLSAVCISKPKICRKILPPLIGILLECPIEAHIKIISDGINQFFVYMCTLSSRDQRYSYSENSEDSDCRRVAIDQDKVMIIEYMLEVVNFVRLQRAHYKARPERGVESLNYLRLEYDKVAQTATIADQNVTAIYYGELWAIAMNKGVPPSSPEAVTSLIGGDDILKMFRKCFVSIGEMDAIDGCGTAHLTSEEEKRKHLINTGQYSDALLLHDIALSCGSQINRQLQHGVVKSLHKSGMHHLALQYIKSLPEDNDLNDIKYECLSFLGDWSDIVDTRDLEEKSKEANCKSYSIIKAFRYSCLKDCLNLQLTSESDRKLVVPLNRAKKVIAKFCQSLNMESCQNVYKVLSKLHLFTDIEDYFAVRCDKTPLSELLDAWRVENLPAFKQFKHLEAIISQRSLVLEHAARECHASLKDIVSLQLQYAELSLSNERVQMAQRLLAVVKKIQETSLEVTLTESQISWAKGHKDIALSLLRNIVANPSPDAMVNAVSLRLYGIWMAESKRDNARDIINKYLKKSLEVLKKSDHQETRLKVYYDIAKFADAEYKQVVSYMKSSIFEKKVQFVDEMNTIDPTQSVTKDQQKAAKCGEKFGKIEEAEIRNTRQEKDTFLQLAMRYYLLSLKHTEINNLSVFRVISLWLDNPGVRLSDDEETFAELLHSTPSRKFITVLPQLAPRLTNERSNFADNLRMLIKRCALEHPHHTLPILFNLKNSEKDKLLCNASQKISNTPAVKSQEPRVTAANALVQELASENNAMQKIIDQMEKLCDATISFANFTPKTKEVKQKVPSAEKINKLGHLDAIPVPTVTLPIRVDCKYDCLPTILAFENYFELVGGINCPKKINCRSSDGITRILLIKGEDDLRQDAVMQQVFNIVNTLLENDPITSRNKLLIRTYKVVPMSKKSGVLEWCEGTMTFGSWLVGSNGAHSRYRPQDISAQAARAEMIKCHQEQRSSKERLASFLKIIKNFHPVFHYFFTEHYLDPVTWYERRLAYTKSVASSSMIGYILGLGDRHVQNILIDKRTAEVVHIDFGIAFDQALTLPTPETVPFRLTQDIIAGFGSSGVEGIFRRSCEKTMHLLRDNQETLLTILEVLLCDPLYSWTVTSKQQKVTAQSRNASILQSGEGGLAKRALLSVSSKLSGAEGGGGSVAVAGQVARLIRTATDPANLARLFHGWQPYL